PENPVERWIPQVAINQERAFAGASEAGRQLAGEHGFALSAPRTGDHESADRRGGLVTHEHGANAIDGFNQQLSWRLLVLAWHAAVAPTRPLRQSRQSADHSHAQLPGYFICATDPAGSEFPIGDAEYPEHARAQPNKDSFLDMRPQVWRLRR